MSTDYIDWKALGIEPPKPDEDTTDEYDEAMAKRCYSTRRRTADDYEDGCAICHADGGCSC